MNHGPVWNTVWPLFSAGSMNLEIMQVLTSLAQSMLKEAMHEVFPHAQGGGCHRLMVWRIRWRIAIRRSV